MTTQPSRERVAVITGPSGVGKGTLVRRQHATPWRQAAGALHMLPPFGPSPPARLPLVQYFETLEGQ